MANYYTFQSDATESQQQLDFFSAPLTMPAGKLDADEYFAEDMDGVTESLFGSGNLSFLSLQSGQSNDQIAMDMDSLSGADDVHISNLAYLNGFIPTIAHAPVTGLKMGDTGYNPSLAAGPSLTIGNASLGNGAATAEHLTGTASASLPVSTLSSGTSLFSPSSYIAMGGNIGDNVGGDTNSSMVVQGDTHNHYSENHTVVENIIQGDVTHIVNNVTNHITDIGGAVTNVLCNVVNNVAGDTVTHITNHLTDLLTGNGHIALNLDATLLDTVGAHVGVLIEDSIAGDISVNAVTAHVTDLVQDLTGLHIPVVADLGAVIGFDLLNGGAGTDNGAGDTDLVINGLDPLGIHLLDIALDPLENLVGDIDLTVNLPTQLLEPAALVGELHDTIESLGNIDIISVPEILDILSPEGLEGALDIEFFDHTFGQGLDVAVGDVLGILPEIECLPGGDVVQGVTDCAQGVVNAVLTPCVIDPVLNLLNCVPETDNGVGDTDLIVTGLEPLGLHIPEITLDPLENLVGDIDLTVNLPTQFLGIVDPVVNEALDLLGGIGGTHMAGDSGITDILSNVWTESAIGNGGLFDDIVHHGNMGDVLPDPVGGVAEGLGALDISHLTHHAGSGLGGLFG